LSLPQDIHTGASPTFVTVKLSALTDGYVPYHVADATGLANSPMFTDGVSVVQIRNNTDSPVDPVLQFAVGATPVVKFTMGVDDSDNDTWKLSVGDILGDDHDVIIISSEGGVPGIDEFTLIDTFTGVSGVWGVCTDGTYIYCSRSTDKKLYKFDITDGTQLAVSLEADTGDVGRCATDGTHVYVVCYSAHVVKKYLCADLSYVASSDVWNALNYRNGICYRAGYLYVANLDAYNVRKIRCSDMGTIWTTNFGLGIGINETDRALDVATDGQFIYVQDSSYGSNRIIRLNMDGTWYDATGVVKTLHHDYHALWCAGDYLYNLVDYGGPNYYVEKRNKSDLSIAEYFDVTPNYVTAGCQWGDYHYLVSISNQGIFKHQYATSSASAPAKMRFRLKNAYGQYVDIATLTADVRLGVGTTIPSETIEAVGNIKAQAGQFISTMATGTAPAVVSSTTVCTNLNAGLWDGYHLPALAVGDMLYGDGTTTVAKLADVAVGSYLRSGGVTTAPLWSTLTLPNAGTAYRLPVFSATNVMTELAAVGATGEYLAGATGAIPAWATLNQAAVAGLTTGSTVDFTGVHATTGLFDHIGEHTGSHTIMFDNTVTLPASTIVPEGGTIGQATGPLLYFNDANNYLKISGCMVGIGDDVPGNKFVVTETKTTGAGEQPLSVFSLTSNQSSDLGTYAPVGLRLSVINTGAGPITNNAAGIFGYIQQNGAGTISVARGFYGQIWNTHASGIITTAYSIQAAAPYITSTGTIGTLIGFQIDAQKHANVTTAYGIYQAGTNDQNYFAGEVGIGASVPYYPLDVSGTIRLRSTNSIRFGGSGSGDAGPYLYSDDAARIRIDGANNYNGNLIINVPWGYSSLGLAVGGTKKWSIYNAPADTDKLIFNNAASGDVAYVTQAGSIGVTGSYFVDDVQVVSNRVIDARCDDAINSGDATTDGVIDALRDAMIAHGLIAAA